MAKINEIAQNTKKRALALFQESTALGYTSYGNLSGQANANIMPEKLTAWLVSYGYSQTLAESAVFELIKTAGNLQQGLYKANQNVYSLLKYGAKVKANAGEPKKTVYFMDWEHPHNNEFAIAQEVTIQSGNKKCLDLVVYINGIAMAVIELEKSALSIGEGIRQNLSNQTECFNQSFFTTMQFVMAGNNDEGLRYSMIDTKEKHCLVWKNDTVNTEAQPLDDVSLAILEQCKKFPHKLDRQLFSMFYKNRFFDLMHNFIVYDKGIKKVCRHNQFFGIKKAQIKLSRNQGGIIWHTQGSGKTLMMVWLSKWILANNPNARVLIVTDRDELDERMEKVYRGVDEHIHRTDSCDDLIDRLNKTDKRLICSLIHKFGLRSNGETGEGQAKQNTEQYIKALKAALPQKFQAKGDFVVFVDECHHTQSGLLHKAMQRILPNAIFIGFTGTPLLVKDKKARVKVFSPGYIHTYQYDEAVADGVVLDVHYEARDMETVVMTQERIDDYFDAKTCGLNDATREVLKAKWKSMQKGYGSNKRLEVIAEDIISDFDIKARLADGNGNAMLVADSIYSACQYYEIFYARGFKKCAIITYFQPLESNLRTGKEAGEEFEKYTVYQKMLGGIKVEVFETEAKRKFVEEPEQMQLLIVVDKRLLGFDAPPCTYLYIDKSLHDHGLFQASCWVTRLDGESKECGYIVDYRQLFEELTNEQGKYATGAFEGYAAEDIGGMMKERLREAKKYLDTTLDALDNLCGGVPYPCAEIDYLHYFCGESGVGSMDVASCLQSRERLCKLVNRLIRGYAAIKCDMTHVGYTLEEQEEIDKKVVFYIALQETIGHKSGDFIDLKSYEADIRRLIDFYIQADESRPFGVFDDFTLLDFVKVQGEQLGGKNKEVTAEAIENNIRKKILEKISINPNYYKKRLTSLDVLIEIRQEGAITYERLLERYLEQVQNVEHPENNPCYPQSIRYSDALRALYDNCGENEMLAIALDEAVRTSKQADFRHNEFKVRRIKSALYKILNDRAEVEQIYNIIVEQGEY